MKHVTAVALVTLLGIASVAADAKPQWFGSSRPWIPGKPSPIWSPLVLIELTPALTEIPRAGAAASAGATAVYLTNVACAPNPSTAIGTCGWAGTYLTDVAAGAADRGKVNWHLSCDITSPCGRYGVGTITAVGRAGGTDDTSTSDLNIVGGTGVYAGLVNGGVMTFGTISGSTLGYTFRFVR